MNESAVWRMSAFASLVPCGMARPLPMKVETEVSRSCIASTYAWSTAPAATSSCPASVIAASARAPQVPGPTLLREVEVGGAVAVVL